MDQHGCDVRFVPKADSCSAAKTSYSIEGGGSLRGERALLERQIEPLPDLDQGFGQRVDQAQLCSPPELPHL
jgi:hypothetical protein